MASTATLVNPVRTRRRASGRAQLGWLFVLPFLVVFIAVLVVPVGYAVYLSLFREQLIGGNSFVGAANYLRALTDGRFLGGLLRVAIFLVVQVPIMLVLALIAAMAIDSVRLYGRSFFRIALFLPYAVPGVVAALIWGFIYGPRFGLVGTANSVLGLHLAPFATTWVLPSIANVVTWEYLGYNMLIFYSALKVIPKDLYEAAELDGASPFHVVLSVKIPALRGAIVIATIFSIIGSFQLFNEPNLLKTLAPNVIGSDFTPNLYAYNLSFAGQEYNYSATIAIVMGVVTAVIAYVVQVRGNREDVR